MTQTIVRMDTSSTHHKHPNSPFRAFSGRMLQDTLTLCFFLENCLFLLYFKNKGACAWNGIHAETSTQAWLQSQGAATWPQNYSLRSCFLESRHFIPRTVDGVPIPSKTIALTSFHFSVNNCGVACASPSIFFPSSVSLYGAFFLSPLTAIFSAFFRLLSVYLTAFHSLTSSFFVPDCNTPFFCSASKIPVEFSSLWKQGVEDADGHRFNGDYYYINLFDSGKMKRRPICCGVFLDWKSKSNTDAPQNNKD
jgi:hypothetical protein